MKKKSRNSYGTAIYKFCWKTTKMLNFFQSNLFVGVICLSFINDVGFCYSRKSLVSIGLPNEIREIRASNYIKFMPNLTKLWYWNNNSISSLESQCPKLTQNGSWHQEIWVPGHGNSIWETRFGPTWKRSQEIHTELLSIIFFWKNNRNIEFSPRSRANPIQAKC